MPDLARRARLILVHGSFHGPWCWVPIVPLLAVAGHEIVLADLGQAEGNDLAAYANHVCGLIDAAPGPVILVGHSMGGIVISQAAEWRADRIAASIYVTGLLLRNGETLTSFIADHADLGVRDLVLENMEVSPDGSLATFPPEAASGIFYNRCNEDDAAWATAQLRPQPTAVYATPLSLSGAAFGSVPRIYIEATEDHAVAPAYQAAMVARLPCDRVISLASDHSPFLSMPGALARVVLEVVREYAPG